MKKMICLTLIFVIVMTILSGCCAGAFPSYTCQECDESFIGTALKYYNNSVDTTVYVCPGCYNDLVAVHGLGN